MARPIRNARARPNRGRTPAAPARFVPAIRLAGVVLALLPLAGCANFVSPLSQWRAAYDGNLFRKLSPEEMADASGPADPNNLFARWMTPKGNPTLKSTEPPPSTMVLGSDGWRPIAKPAPDPEADAEFQAAMKLFEQGKFEEAEKPFAKIAKNRKQTTWGENAQFYVAECQYQRKKYVERPRQLREAPRRLPGDEPSGQAHPARIRDRADLAGADRSQGAPEKKLPWTARFDGQLPIIDTDGSGLKALEHVEHNNPEGPLADKAGIAIADFYMKHADYETAAMYYDQFIEFYGKKKTPFLQYAQLAGIDARIKSYDGPDYDASGLEKARRLIGQTMSTFPERPAGFEKLYLTLDHINDAEAEKTYLIGMQYKRRKKVASAEYYLGKVPQRWPNSPWAVKAKTELAELAKMPRKPSKPSRIIIPPGATDPFMSTGPMGGMMGGMGMGGMGMGGMGMGGMGMPGGMM